MVSHVNRVLADIPPELSTFVFFQFRENENATSWISVRELVREDVFLFSSFF